MLIVQHYDQSKSMQQTKIASKKITNINFKLAIPLNQTKLYRDFLLTLFKNNNNIYNKRHTGFAIQEKINKNKEYILKQVYCVNWNVSVLTYRLKKHFSIMIFLPTYILVIPTKS